MNRIPKDKTQKTKYKVGTGDQSRAAGSELLVVNLFSETCASSTDSPARECDQQLGRDLRSDFKKQVPGRWI